jgi:hypothetical protein
MGTIVKALLAGHTEIIDADSSSYLDSSSQYTFGFFRGTKEAWDIFRHLDPQALARAAVARTA